MGALVIPAQVSMTVRDADALHSGDQ